MTARVLEIELSQPIGDIDIAQYQEALVLVRLHRRPLGCVRLPCPDGTLRAADLRAKIASDWRVSYQLKQAQLFRHLLQPEPSADEALPSWSVVICTRDRTADLQRCLDSLMNIETPGGEIIVVDNAPSDDATAQLAARYPVRYVREDRAGLNWARSCGARAAKGDVVIYTDDDVVVDAGWIAAIVEPFKHPRVSAVTGLTLPLELETPAQELFEQYGGFGRGFVSRTFDYMVIPPAAAGMVGAGANMALRRELINGMQLFDAELDCGTITRTGGDAYAFYQLLAEGYQIVYTPEALTWHRHRRDYANLRRTLAGYSVGGFAYLTRCLVQHGDWQAVSVGFSWFVHDHLRQLARTVLRRRRALPLDLVLAQIWACPIGPWAYYQSRKHERAGRQ